MRSSSLHGHLLGYMSCEPAQASGRGPPPTASAPSFLQLHLSLLACLRTATPPPTNPRYKYSPDPRLYIKSNQTTKTFLPSQCITIFERTSMNTNDIQSGITFFPEYTPACSALQQILERILRRRTPKAPLNGLTSPLGPSTVPASLCKATASLGIVTLEIASEDTALPS